MTRLGVAECRDTAASRTSRTQAFTLMEAASVPSMAPARALSSALHLVTLGILGEAPAPPEAWGLGRAADLCSLRPGIPRNCAQPVGDAFLAEHLNLPPQ